MKIRLTWLTFSLGLLLTAYLLLAGCVGTTVEDPVSYRTLFNKKYYLTQNLHVDPNPSLNRISTVNYQIAGNLIPAGTEMLIAEDETSSTLIFKAPDLKKTFYFEFSPKTLHVISKTAYLNRLFAADPQPIKDKIARLSSEDQEGIRRGLVRKGMTREGTLIALGSPPDFENPDPMNASSWSYWYNRHKKFTVLFGADGKVSDITGHYPSH